MTGAGMGEAKNFDNGRQGVAWLVPRHPDKPPLVSQPRLHPAQHPQRHPVPIPLRLKRLHACNNLALFFANISIFTYWNKGV
jgi:hypothetical protein